MTSQESGWDLVKRCALALDIDPETVRKWRERKSVPHRWRMPLLQEFGKQGRAVSFDFFDTLEPRSEANTAESDAAE